MIDYGHFLSYSQLVEGDLVDIEIAKRHQRVTTARLETAANWAQAK